MLLMRASRLLAARVGQDVAKQRRDVDVRPILDGHAGWSASRIVAALARDDVLGDAAGAEAYGR
jgi:hypothetical protein